MWNSDFLVHAIHFNFMFFVSWNNCPCVSCDVSSKKYYCYMYIHIGKLFKTLWFRVLKDGYLSFIHNIGFVAILVSNNFNT